MKDPEEPMRLSEDPSAPESLAKALQAARNRGPSHKDLGNMAAALGIAAPVSVPPPPPRPMTPPTPAGAATGSAATGTAATTAAAVAKVGLGHIAIGLGVVGTASVIAWAMLAGKEAPRPAPPERAHAPIVAPAPVVEPSPALPPEPADEAADLIVAPDTATTPDEPSSTRRSHRRHGAREAVATPAPEPEVTPAPAATPSAAEIASRLREEASLVRRAERLLSSSPAKALRLAEDRARLFPQGVLDQEAEIIAIDALIRLDRRDDALARAQRFDAMHPGSLHARAVRRLIEAPQ